MTEIRIIESETTTSRKTSIITILLIVGVIVLAEFIGQGVKPQKYTGSMREWLTIITLAIIVCIYLLIDKQFIKAKFDLKNESLTINYMTTISGYKEYEIKFINLKFQERKEGSLRKTPSRTLTIFDKHKRIIKVDESYIGANTFKEITTEIKLISSRTNSK